MIESANFSNLPSTWYDKFISMSSPLIKMWPEMRNGVDYYPEGPVGVGSKYTPTQNLARKTLQLVGLDKVYTVLESTPRGMDAFEFFGVKSLGTEQDAWQQQRSMAYTYSKEVLEKEPYTSSGYGDETDYRRDSIYNMIKYGRYEDAIGELESYVQYLQDEEMSMEDINTEITSLQTSLKNKFDVIPSNAIPKKDLQGYINTLSDNQINDLMLAYEYQKNITGPFYEWLYGN